MLSLNEQYNKLKVEKNATDEEIKNAFIARKKEIELKRCETKEQQEAVKIQLEEISNAFDEIMNNRRLTRIRNKKSGKEFYEEEQSEKCGENFLKHIENLINQNKIDEAEHELELINPKDRNAYWNFLKGLVFLNRGWLNEAEKFLEMATKMDPSNSTYRSTYEQLIRQSQGHFSRQNAGFNSSNQQYPPIFCCGGLDCCARIMIAELCCECCGGGSGGGGYGGGYGC